MKKKTVKIIGLLAILFSYTSISYAADTGGEDNILSRAFAQRKATLMQIVSGGKLESEINRIKTELAKVQIKNDVNKTAKDNLLKSIDELEQKIIELNQELVKNIQESPELDEVLRRYNEEMLLKEELVQELDKSIKENELNYEKMDVLIKTYIHEKEKNDETAKKENQIKILIFLIITTIVVLVYGVSTYLSKNKKLNVKSYVYINFFLAFAYIIFLIAYFFYLYPQFSVFLIFMSGYLLVINAHLIGSFIGSLIVLQRFKIGEIIRTSNGYGKISNITPLYIVLYPLTDDGIYDSKSTYIPHINILREAITQEKNPEITIHTFKTIVKEDSGVDVMKFISEVETSILQKFLHLRLKTLVGRDDIYRISFEFVNIGHYVINFTWRGDTILNNKVERKIVGLLSTTVNDIRKQKELEAEQKQIKESQNKDEASIEIQKNQI